MAAAWARLTGPSRPWPGRLPGALPPFRFPDPPGSRWAPGAWPRAASLHPEGVAGGDNHHGVMEETVAERGSGALPGQEAAPLVDGRAVPFPG